METKTGTLRSALRHRDFRVLLAGYATSAVGDWLYSVVLVVYVFDVTGSPGWVAITSFVRFAPVVLLGTLGGEIADRYDRKRVLIITDLARFVVMAALTLVAAARGPAWAAAVCAAVSVTFSSAYRPAVSAVVPTLAGEEDLAAANTLVSTIESVSLALGPAMGAVLLVLGSPAIAFAINAVTFLVSAACNATIRTPLTTAITTEEAGTRLRERIGAGFRAILGSPGVRVLVGLSVAFTVFYGQEIVLYAAAANDLLRIGDDGLALIWASMGVGGILAAGISSRIAERPQLTSALALAAFVSALPMMCLSFVSAEPVVYALLLVEGAAVGIADVIFVTMLQRSVDGNVLGRVFGILDSLMVAGILVGSVLAPVVVELAGIRVALIVGGGILVAATVVALPRARTIDRVAADRAEELSGIVEGLRRTSIFAEAGQTVLEALAAATSVERVPASQVVVAEGERANDLYVVVDGSLAVSSKGETGHEQHVRDLYPGDHFGEIGILERRPRTATVTTTTACELYRIKGDDFVRAVSEAPRLSGRFAHTAAFRLARTHPSESLGHA